MIRVRRSVAAALVVVFTTAGTAGAASIDVPHAAVAAEHRLASQAGLEVLARGGNAVDAAVAAALATGVVNPASSGIGGGGFVVIWDARRERAATVDFRETAPRGATESMFVRPDGTVDSSASKTGPLAIAVPGELRGLELARKRYGRLALAEDAAPAIRIARDGFVVEAHLASMIATGHDKVAADPELAHVFLHPDGSPVKEGERLSRPELAATLERIVHRGVDDFYEGEIAHDIVAAVAAARTRFAAKLPSSAAPLDAHDLRSYRAVERDPLRMTYRGHEIVSMPPPSSGGPVLDEALGVLAGWSFDGVPFQGPTWGQALTETMKAVFADRATWYGDPDFTKIPLARLLGAQHAAEIRARITWTKALTAAEIAPRVDAASDAGTSHISVVDAEGNAAALTTSINTGFGSGVAVPGRDIILNNTMDDFSAQPGKPNAFGLVGSKANSIAPGKRPLSSMTPVIVLDDGKVRLVAGASGGPLIISSTLETVVGVLDFGQSTDRAVTAPRIHHQWLPDVLMVEPGVPEPTRQALERVGNKVTPLSAKASVQAIEVTGSGTSRMLHATSDPRKGGVPVGY